MTEAVRSASDLTFDLRDPEGRLTAVMLVEVVDEIDEQEALSWPLCAFLQRARTDAKVPILFVVVAHTDDVETWATKVLRDGMARVIEWQVIGPAIMRHIDTLAAKPSPLAALMHAATMDVAEARIALKAFSDFSPEQRTRYLDVFTSCLRPEVRGALS
jgi:hypothetical protein